MKKETNKRITKFQATTKQELVATVEIKQEDWNAMHCTSEEFIRTFIAEYPQYRNSQFTLTEAIRDDIQYYKLNVYEVSDWRFTILVKPVNK